MRKRLTFLRTIVAFIAIFSTSIFISNFFIEFGGNESNVIVRSGRGGVAWKGVTPDDNNSTWNRVNSTLNSIRSRERRYGVTSMDEVESLKLQVDGLHKQLTRLQLENIKLQQQFQNRNNLTDGSTEAAVTSDSSSNSSSSSNNNSNNNSNISTSRQEETQTDPPPSEHLFQSILSEDLVRQKLISSEILEGGQSHRNEYELTPFARFTMNRIYLVEPGLQRRVVEKLVGFKRGSLEKIIISAVAWLNENRNSGNSRGAENFHLSNFSLSPTTPSNFPPTLNSSAHQTLSSRRVARPYKPSDFLEGIYRTVPGMSEHYELYFRDLDTPRSYRTVVMARVFSAPLVISSRLQPVASNLIHVIVPLQGRELAFQQFMEKFEEVCIRARENVFLTIVHFGGGREFASVDGVVSDVRSRTGFQNIRLMSLKGEFSRGRALMAGATWSLREETRDVLLFFCDVDVFFTSDFLQRCRLNAEPGSRVYYPILFSLYNPNTTIPSMHDAHDVIEAERAKNTRASRSDRGPPLADRTKSGSHQRSVITISVDSGFWRDFGYGMTCQYLSDFRRSGGFDTSHKGWGMEDVYLYRKYVKSRLMVIRATDPGILHIWHDKTCAYDLPPDQYKSCIRSKALNEASHAQLGMMLFRKEIENHFLKTGRTMVT